MQCENNGDTREELWRYAEAGDEGCKDNETDDDGKGEEEGRGQWRWAIFA